MDQLSKTSVDAIADLAKQAGFVVTTVSAPAGAKGIPTSIPVVMNPKDGETLNLKPMFDSWRDTPERKQGVARVSTLDSFIELTNRHKNEASVIFADTDWRKPSLTAVIDYHKANTEADDRIKVGAADNGKHRVDYKFPLSEEWQAWVKADKQPMNQQAFAEFIEDHIAELAAPDKLEIDQWQDRLGGKIAYPNELKLLSIGLKVHAETRVSNAVTLQSGEGELTWQEEHRDMKGDKLIVPSLFIVQLPPFFMGEPIRLPVRLRYRVREGAVTWIFQMYRPDVFVTEQVMRDLERAAEETKLPAYQGAPEMSA